MNHHPLVTVGCRGHLALLVAALAGCASRSTDSERFLVSDLLRDPGGYVSAREVPPGTRDEQMQDLALTLRECLGPDIWIRDGISLLIDDESLVVQADRETIAQVGAVLADMRRADGLSGGSGR